MNSWKCHHAVQHLYIRITDSWKQDNKQLFFTGESLEYTWFAIYEVRYAGVQAGSLDELLFIIFLILFIFCLNQTHFLDNGLNIW